MNNQTPPPSDRSRQEPGDDGRALFRTINEFALKLLVIPSEDELVWYVARQVVGRLGFGDCVVYLIEPERKLLRQRAAIGIKNPEGNQIVNALEIPLGKGITGRVAQSLQPLIVDDVSRDDSYIPDVEPALSEICVPLIIDGRAVGVIDCEDPRRAHFGQEHLEILATVAAMTSARLKIIHDARRAEERSTELYHLNEQLRAEIAERRHAEEALRKSQAQLQSIMDHSPALITIKDLDGRYTYVSPAYSDYFGIPAEWAVGRKAVDFLPTDAGATIRDGDQAAIDKGTAQQLDSIYSKKIGSPNLLVTKFPIRDDQGEVTGLGTIAIDITEQRQAEDRLRQASQLAGIGHYVWDSIEDRCLFCSEQHAGIHGLSVEEFVSSASTLDSSLTLIHPDDRRTVHTAIERLRRGETINIEYRINTPSGETRHVREIAEPVFDEAGRVVQEIGTTQDVSAIKQAETLLVRAIDASPAVFALFGPDDRLVICNKKYRDMYETEAAPMVAGVPFEDLVRAFATRVGVGTTRSETEEWVARRLNRRNNPARSYQYQRGDGEWIEAGDYTLEDGSVFTVGQVITEKKTMEAQFQQAQKMEAIGQLTGGVAHDFNNLLAVIQGNAELLSETMEGGTKRMQAIMRAAKRGGELTHRLLAFSRQTPLQPQPIDPGGLLTGMSDLLAVSLGAAIEVKIGAADGLWSAMADPGQVENALLNLALNARDAMPGGGHLTIECANASLGEADLPDLTDGPKPEAGDYVVLAVSDTGEGMAPDVAARAFEPFFTTKEVGQGSGLGLSMVYGFARQSGGFAAIDSAEGRGTTVRLYLPRAESGSAAAEAPPHDAVPRGQGEHILVIEDDADVREFTVEMLEGLGYSVTAVADAAAARTTLDKPESSGAPDLLLSDVVLPGGTSGPRFAEEALARLPGLRVIFMSGYPAEEDGGEAGHDTAGVSGAGHVLLSKPFHRRRLAEALRNALD